MTSFRNVMMFKRPDFGVTIGSAGEQLKGRASAVNGCCDDEGFGEVVERCVLDPGTRSR